MSQEPWESAGNTPEPNLLEKILIIGMMIISAIFFRSPKRK